MATHVLAVPLPAQGHINPMMRLCKTLANHGVLVTFVEAEPIHLRLQQLQQHEASQLQALHPQPKPQPHPALANGVNGNPVPPDAALCEAALPPTSQVPIRRVHVPIDGLDLSNDFAVSLQSYFESLTTMTPHLKRLLEQLNQSPTPVTCIISDFWMTVATQSVADEFRIPRTVLFPSSQSLLLLFHHLITHTSATIDRALQVVAKEPPWPADAEIFAEGLEGLPSIIRAADLPHFHHVVDDNLCVYGYFKQAMVLSFERAHSMLVNSFDELESPAFTAMARRAELPIYGIGNLVEPLANESATSLWQEDEACMSWLGKQPPLSVLYISFGSVTILSEAQYGEIVHGLLSSQQRFLWALRPSLVEGGGDSGRRLLEEAVREGRGCIAGWVPQLKVLAHPATAAFLTHCGWNSTTEAICHGVPMLCWPYFADQPLDAKYIAEEWRIGLRFGTIRGQRLIERGEVEKSIRAIVQGEDGKVLQENCRNLKEASSRAFSPKGTSYHNMKAWLYSLHD